MARYQIADAGTPLWRYRDLDTALKVARRQSAASGGAVSVIFGSETVAICQRGYLCHVGPAWRGEGPGTVRPPPYA